MNVMYAEEKSHLRSNKVLLEFLSIHTSRFWRRYFYSYLVCDFNVSSVCNLVSLELLHFGLYGWIRGVLRSTSATSVTVMLAALPVIVGIQCWIAFLHYDVGNVPIDPLSRLLNETD